MILKNLIFVLAAAQDLEVSTEAAVTDSTLEVSTNSTTVVSDAPSTTAIVDQVGPSQDEDSDDERLSDPEIVVEIEPAEEDEAKKPDTPVQATTAEGERPKRALFIMSPTEFRFPECTKEKPLWWRFQDNYRENMERRSAIMDKIHTLRQWSKGFKDADKVAKDGDQEPERRNFFDLTMIYNHVHVSTDISFKLNASDEEKKKGFEKFKHKYMCNMEGTALWPKEGAKACCAWLDRQPLIEKTNPDGSTVLDAEGNPVMIEQRTPWDQLQPRWCGCPDYQEHPEEYGPDKKCRFAEDYFWPPHNVIEHGEKVLQGLLPIEEEEDEYLVDSGLTSAQNFGIFREVLQLNLKNPDVAKKFDANAESAALPTLRLLKEKGITELYFVGSASIGVSIKDAISLGFDIKKMFVIEDATYAVKKLESTEVTFMNLTDVVKMAEEEEPLTKELEEKSFGCEIPTAPTNPNRALILLNYQKGFVSGCGADDDSVVKTGWTVPKSRTTLAALNSILEWALGFNISGDHYFQQIYFSRETHDKDSGEPLSEEAKELHPDVCLGDMLKNNTTFEEKDTELIQTEQQGSFFFGTTTPTEAQYEAMRALTGTAEDPLTVQKFVDAAMAADAENEITVNEQLVSLKNKNIEFLFIAGLPMTEVVLATAREARKLGWQVYMILDISKGYGDMQGMNLDVMEKPLYDYFFNIAETEHIWTMTRQYLQEYSTRLPEQWVAQDNILTKSKDIKNVSLWMSEEDEACPMRPTRGCVSRDPPAPVQPDVYPDDDPTGPTKGGAAAAATATVALLAAAAALF